MVATDNTVPSGASLNVVFQARLKDSAGNVATTGPTSSHRVGLLDCLTLRNLNTSHDAAPPSGPVNPKNSTVCTTCHARATAGNGTPIQRLPGLQTGPFDAGTGYWCAVSAGTSAQEALQSPFAPR